MSEISQKAMLAEIDIAMDEDSKPICFELEYITKEGEYRHYKKLGKNFKKPTTSKAEPKKTNNYRVKEKGVIRVYDFEEETQKTLLIDSIISFNKMRVK